MTDTTKELNATDPPAPQAAPADLASVVGRFADGVRAAGAQTRELVDAKAERLKQEAMDHPLETVTGAFGLGYLVGKSLFKRWR